MIKYIKHGHKNTFSEPDEKYEHVYQRCIEICPDMKPLIEKIRLIPPPKRNEREILLKKMKLEDKSAKIRLVEMYLRNALRISLEYSEKSSLPLDEIFSKVVIGLIKRLNNPTKNKNYLAYIHNGMRSDAEVYIKKYAVKFLSYEEYCKKIKDKIFYDGEKFLIHRLYIKQLNLLLNSVLSLSYLLTYSEETILRMRYGLGNDEEYTYKQIAEIFDTNKEQIRITEQRALRKLNKYYKHSNKFTDFEI